MRDFPAVAMEWRDGLFAHWPVDPSRVRSLVPDELDVDARDGTAWVSALPSVVAGTRPWFLPEVAGTTFPQVNLRTYVRHETRPGVYFLSLDTTSALGVRVARAMYGLPYHRAEIDFERMEGDLWRNEVGDFVRTEDGNFGQNGGNGLDNAGQGDAGQGERGGVGQGEHGDGRGGRHGDARRGEQGDGGRGGRADVDRGGRGNFEQAGRRDFGQERPVSEGGVSGGPRFRFDCQRVHDEEPPARFTAEYRPTGRPSRADPDSLAEFLAERYRAYVVRDGSVWCARVEHAPWRLCPAEASVHADALLEGVGLSPPAADPLVHYSPGTSFTIRTPFRP